HARPLRRPGAPPAAAGAVAAGRLAGAAPPGVAAPVDRRDRVRAGAVRRAGLAPGCLGPARPAVDPVEHVRRPPARAPRRLLRGRPAGGGARGLVVAALAVRRDRQAAGAAAAAGPPGPEHGHGLGVAGHCRGEPGFRTAAHPLHRRARGARADGKTGSRSRPQAAAMVNARPTRILHVTTITEWRGGDAQMYQLYG